MHCRKERNQGRRKWLPFRKNDCSNELGEGLPNDRLEAECRSVKPRGIFRRSSLDNNSAFALIQKDLEITTPRRMTHYLQESVTPSIEPMPMCNTSPHSMASHKNEERIPAKPQSERVTFLRSVERQKLEKYDKTSKHLPDQDLQKKPSAEKLLNGYTVPPSPLPQWSLEEEPQERDAETTHNVKSDDTVGIHWKSSMATRGEIIPASYDRTEDDGEEEAMIQRAIKLSLSEVNLHNTEPLIEPSSPATKLSHKDVGNESTSSLRIEDVAETQVRADEDERGVSAGSFARLEQEKEMIELAIERSLNESKNFNHFRENDARYQRDDHISISSIHVDEANETQRGLRKYSCNEINTNYNYDADTSDQLEEQEQRMIELAMERSLQDSCCNDSLSSFLSKETGMDEVSHRNCVSVSSIYLDQNENESVDEDSLFSSRGDSKPNISDISYNATSPYAKASFLLNRLDDESEEDDLIPENLTRTEGNHKRTASSTSDIQSLPYVGDMQNRKNEASLTYLPSYDNISVCSVASRTSQADDTSWSKQRELVRAQASATKHASVKETEDERIERMELAMLEFAMKRSIDEV